MPRSSSRLWLALAAVMALTACGQGSMWSDELGIAGTRIRFAISVQPEEAKAVAEVVRKFEAKTKTGVSLDLFTRFRDQSGAKVTLDPVGSNAMVDLLSREGSKIHLFAQDNGALAPLVAQGLVQKPAVRIPDGVMASMKEGGSGFFLPFRPNVRLSYANRAEFARAGVEPPENLEQLKDVAARLKQVAPKNEAKVTLSLSHADGGAPAGVTLSELILAFGGDPAQLDGAGAIDAFRFLQDLARQGLLARESFLAKHDTEPAYLMDGAAWLAQNWSVTTATLEKAGRLGDFEVHPGWQPRHVVGGDMLGIPVGVAGNELKAARALALFLMSEEAQAVLVERNAWPSIRDDVYENLPGSPTKDAVRKALADGWYRPTTMYWGSVVDAMNEAVDRVVVSFEPPETVLRELHARVAQAHSDYPRRS